MLRELYAVLSDEPLVDRIFFANPEGGSVALQIVALSAMARIMRPRWVR